ncbi:zinc finger C3H1 domain-containing protein isoform X2 [Clupea harengus]|uniref:Zinc finger C3H1 domain-containing protein isoform X2 n=1 Tax=Clupea harengus TaxID=7950 RepID=A0A6P8EY84_CLUHA|nr:zinc finger C3H1 domain-containing protein isoform X2 [Clupea harengus]
MEVNSGTRSPREEGELEDGEICDDETDEKLLPQEGMRPRNANSTRCNRKSKGPVRTLPPMMGSPAQDFRVMMPFNRGPHLHGPFPPSHRQQIGPSGPDRLLPGQDCDPSPRSSFWERSHTTLGRLRNRGKTINDGRGDWARGGRGDGGGGPRENGRPPVSRYAFGDSHLNRKESPQRKQKQFGRNQTRKQAYSAQKAENGVEESFEDLLIKYKQIQLELECIRKEENMALEPVVPKQAGAASGVTTTPEAEVEMEVPDVEKETGTSEQLSEPEKDEKKIFQAFNIKPLRQKLLTPAERDALNSKTDEEPENKEEEPSAEEQTTTVQEVAAPGAVAVAVAAPAPGAAALEEEEEEEDEEDEEEEEEDKDIESDLNISCLSNSQGSLLKKGKGKGKDEDEDMSELQLRLLALQSASRKWQQKEQQVMKESKEKITKAKPAQPDKSGSPQDRVKMVTRSSTEKAKALAAASAKPQEKGKSGADKGKAGTKAHAAGKKTTSPGSAAKQAWRMQRLRAWKLQQQHEQEEQQRRRQEEEEERKKREEEIRKIRDLSNQDEQYNRFMKLVGSKHHPRSKSVDNENRKSLSKQGLDTSGNLYQYDNYDEVAMDTDSEPESPASSPVRDPFSTEATTCVPHMPAFPMHPTPSGMELAQCFLDHFSLVHPLPPPPLPPMPPPDELEQPPKPPFADEEEEEEMLLRKELLKSLVCKRTVKPEETVSGNSGPPSPSPSPSHPVKPALLPTPRSNLTAVSLNTVIPQPRHASSKFARSVHVPRAPLVLPRHKAVVVQLNDSDDSDSDCDATGSPAPSHSIFGGLESMIKEARRTAEAAKPKGSKSEKENNPIRMLPDVRKLEHLWKEELASRERQRLSRLAALKGVPSPVGSDSELDVAGKVATLRLAEAEDKLAKHRTQLEKDELLLKQLLQAELKKKEFLKAAETKVTKLREQLMASEKIVGANRVLLKKLQEQTYRVQHRITLKRQQAQKLERDLSQAQASAQGGTLKRKNASLLYSPVKMLRTDGGPRTASERHFADLIAQKQRLQRLEAEYALKIQKLKEAQALRQQVEQRPAPPQKPPATPFPVPQPSLHDLTQDKLTLGSEDLEPDEDEQPPSFATASASSPILTSSATPATVAAAAAAAPAAITPTSRRRSFHNSGAFTKPKLQIPKALHTSTPAKEDLAKPAKPTKASASAGGSAGPGLSELYLGLSMEELKQRYQKFASVEDLLQSELTALGGAVGEKLPCGKAIQVDVEPLTAPASRVELKPVPFGAYHSPLLAFKSYRFSPYFRTKEKLSLISVSHSNVIEPKKFFCRFDLTGTCNDDDCKWQHMRNCTLSGNQLTQDILSYNLPLIGCSENSSTEEISVATEKYIKKLFGSNRDRMGTDQKAVLLVSKVNESKGHVPPFTTCKERRRWKPEPQRPPRPEETSDGEKEGLEGLEAPSQSQYEAHTQANLLALDVCVNPDDKRYFDSETDDISNLETSVLESPKDVQLWIKLAFKYLNQKEIPATERLDAALNTLSRALEDNRDNSEVWCHYLTLFSRRGTSEELQEMCDMAVQHAPDYDVWWTYMNMESSFEGKDFVCGRMLHYLVQTADGAGEERRSFRLLESLLYRAQLSLFTGRQQNALDILQNALKSDGEQSLAAHLGAADRALAWLCLIHVTECGRLPPNLYNPADSSPSRVVCTKPAPQPWGWPSELRTPADQLVGLYQDAIKGCSEEGPSQSESPSPTLPLHADLVALYRRLDRLNEAVTHCEGVLSERPDCCPLLESLAELQLARGEEEKALAVWQEALRQRPHNAKLLYHTCKFLLCQERSSAIDPLFREFMLSLCEPDQTDLCPLDVLRHLLGLPREAILSPPRVKASLQGTIRQQLPYLSLVHCTWQSVHGGIPEALNAFESALGRTMSLEVVQKIWLDYLLFASSKLVGSQPAARDLKLFADLVQRCLVCVPTRLTVPFSSTRYWSCFHFHNQVIAFYLGCMPQAQHLAVLERLRQSMPSNPQLSIRLLHQERRDGSVEHLRFQSRGLCASLPNCLAYWKIAIAVEREQKGKAEVRRLYQQALQKLPLCATLWKDRLLFEAAEGGKTDTLKKLVDKCQELGVSLTEALSLGQSSAAGTEH